MVFEHEYHARVYCLWQRGIQTRGYKQWQNKKLFRLENFHLISLIIQVCFGIIFKKYYMVARVYIA